jgi:Tol biopolymer transport system component
VVVDEQPWIERIEFPSGARRRLVPGAFPSCAPDGVRLAYTDCASLEDGEPFVAVVDVDGSDARRLCPGILPRWSPRGDRILLTRAASDGEPVQDRVGGLAVIRPDGSDERVLADEGFAPRWSRDATRIAFVRGSLFARELVVIDAEDGTELLVLELDPTALDEPDPSAP